MAHNRVQRKRPIMRSMYAATFAMSLVALLSCGPLNAAAPAVPPDWITLDAGGVFTLRAPPGTIFYRTRTIDNSAGGFKGPGFELEYEYGMNNDDLSSMAGSRNHSVQKTQIDGHSADVVAALDVSVSNRRSPYFVGLYAPSAAPTYSAFAPFFRALTVWGYIDQEKDVATVKLMYQTIHFPK